MKKYLLAAGIVAISASPLCAGMLDNFFQKTVSGKYRASFETSAFYPQGMDEVWWAEGGEPGNLPDGCFKDATFRGKVSDKGEHGHLGQYVRLFTVSKIIKYTKIDCKDFDKVK